MPSQGTHKRAQQRKREGRAPSTQAGEFVREEMHHLAEGKHAKSRKQAVAIGLSKARKAGVKVGKRTSASSSRRPAPGKARGAGPTRRKSRD